MKDDRTPSLFPPSPEAGSARHAPLAERMRPETLEEVVGQEKLLAPGSFLREAMERDEVPSMIFWGPPGVGKTTLARVMARQTRARFESLSAVLAGVKDVKQIVARARHDLQVGGRRTILFVDEIHRFNKAQQDAFLPHVEDGTIVLIGATTENPSFEVIAPLLSRCRVLVLEPLSEQDVLEILRRALADETRGLATLEVGERQAFEHQHLRPGQKRGVQLEGGVLGGGADEQDGAVFHMRQEPVLLRLVEAVDLVDEQERALPVPVP